MDIEDIKRGLRAEIKKRESEQYATFQCNVRQMCKDVLAKLEEQESAIAELKQKELHQKYKRCLAMAKLCAKNVDHLNSEGYIYEKEGNAKELADCITGTEFYDKWYNRWLELAEKFKPNKEAEEYR